MSRSRRPTNHPSARSPRRPGAPPAPAPPAATPPSAGRSLDDRGQVLPLIALVVVLAAVVVLAVGSLGSLIVDRAQARNLADAAALAGAVGGEAEAVAVVEAAGGSVESFARHVDGIEVTVTVGRARATSRARAAP